MVGMGSVLLGYREVGARLTCFLDQKGDDFVASFARLSLYLSLGRIDSACGESRPDFFRDQ